VKGIKKLAIKEKNAVASLIFSVAKTIYFITMAFLSLQPFVPAGQDIVRAKNFFQELGFQLRWDAGDHAAFESGNCKFILQKSDDEAFAENFMISVRVTSADEFWKEVKEKGLVEKYGVRLTEPANQSYGREVNIIDLAGVCWHFVEG
jgi:hypothetical protein